MLGRFGSPLLLVVRLIKCKEKKGETKRDRKKNAKSFRFLFVFSLFSRERIILYNLSICSQLGVFAQRMFELNQNGVGGSGHAPSKMSESAIVFHFAECRVNLTSFRNIIFLSLPNQIWETVGLLNIALR